ncbi:ATP-binding cassette domain-containing protein [Flammeovirga pacifica]|uniref:ABC transporter domain-containing protein n=1 Tax=Flammeovirga pacifica TaxID=915059 RepID=A0A1S1YYV1_FLAPC|nr:ATP-binding cassette domain-containing protein [Flammeovirga pacifica]OHX66194.1 hypothetical protein NH26_07435 [Flammeovirga pacifica]
MISLHNISISYQKNKVINSLDLTLDIEKIHGLVGLNGAGKSTLLQGIFGLLPLEEGNVLYHQKDISKKDIAFLSTENYFYSYTTGRDYLSLFSDDKIRIEELNTLFQLSIDQMIDDYSTGMKKKLALMGVLLQDKDILILDEPFNGVDLESSRVIHLILDQLASKGKTIIITSHILETLTSLCHQIHYLKGGVIKSSKNKAQFDEFEKDIFGEIHQKNEEKIQQLFK